MDNSTLARFEAKVIRGYGGSGPGGEECWVWVGARGGVRGGHAGYGHMKLGGRRGYVHLTHRLAYEHWVGPVPPDRQLDHLCRNRTCCNPAHLEPVTCRENILRGTSPSARQARQTHCKRGHEFSAQNTYTFNGRRACKICTLTYNRKKRARYRRVMSGGLRTSVLR